MSDDRRPMSEEPDGDGRAMSADAGGHDQSLGNVDPDESPLAAAIRDREEVFDVSVRQAHRRAIVLVTFAGWTIPPRFAEDYDMALVSAYMHDPRPWWKQVSGWGPPARLVGHFVRDAPPEVSGR